MGPVLFKEGEHVTSVDVVKLVAEHPLVFNVVNLEAAVCRYVIRLNGAKIGSKNLRVWVFIGLVIC